MGLGRLTIRRNQLHWKVVVFSLLVVVLIVPIARCQAQSGRGAVPQATGRAPLMLLPDRGSLPARENRPQGDAWAPPDIDVAVPSVTHSDACSLPDVVSQADKRVQELVNNLDRFTATEFVEHQTVGWAGKLAKAQGRKFDYLVSIGPSRSGYLSMQEYRSRAGNSAQFPDQIVTEGTPSLALVFHPRYAPDFDMKCEGLGVWQGQPAWQVRFEGLPDRASHLSGVVVKNKRYTVRLRGRAWILANSYQMARLETDLADTIPAIRLRLQHLSVEYRPVAFPGRQTTLWLPASAELYLDFWGHRFYRKHRFTDFTLFSVDVNQVIARATDASLPR